MVILQLEEQPPLIQAIFSGEVDAVKKLLESKQDVNYQDFEKRSALHAAAFRGDPIMTKLLIDHGARVNTKDCKWVTPLHRACYSGSEETVTILLNNAADTCARDRLWQTPLHIAAASNSLECVSYLLDRIQNPNVTDRSGRTALHHAVLNGHNDIVELLISRGCIVNACDKKDCRPMHWAAYKGHVDTIELLLQHGADINAKDRNQYTPLHVAAASGAISVIDDLIENGADIEAQNAYGNTPLHIACLNGHGNFAGELVRYRADTEAANYRGQTALHLAAASTHGVHCLNLLVSRDVDINRQSLDGRTPLHMTAIHGRFTRSKTLIDKGAVVDCVDKNGCTALHIAAHYGHELLSNTLLSYGAEPARKGYDGRTPLHMCCLAGYIECCRIFIKAGVDLNDRDDTGKTPLHCAAYKGAVECVDLLVSSGADFRIVDDVGRIALHYAAAQGFFFCVFTLVGIGSPVNQADQEGCTALHLAAAYDIDGRCVNYLIEHKADPKLKDANGFTPIHYAVAGNNLNALKYLLYAVGNFALYGPDMPPTTPLHIAARNGNMEILEKLMPYLPDPNVRNEHGCTPLLLAARQGFANCVQLLLRFGAKVSICDTPDGLSPVHHSAKNGHVHCLALLVDNAEDKTVIDLPDARRRTALMLAISNSHVDCVTTLLKSGADPNIVDGEGHSCLFRAVVTGQHNILQMLLPRSSIVNERDIYGKTALHVASGCGRLSCIQRILPYMSADVKESLDKQDCTALHWACYSGSADCVAHFFNEGIFQKMEGNAFSPVHCAASVGSEKCLELLCAQYDCEIVKMKDDRQRTPLHVAALLGQAECVKILLEQGADINQQDEDGKTPLISAAFNGQTQVIELLIDHKADMTLYDKNGNTALHIACLYRHSNAALLLLEYVSQPELVNMVNCDRKTALHLTARNGLVDVTRQLIAKGSSVTAVDANGLTPALCCAPDPSVAQCLAIILASHSAQSTANGKDPPPPIALNYLKTDAKTSTTTLKSRQHRNLQTDMTLIRDPDQFELERMFEIKFQKSTTASPSSIEEEASVSDGDSSRFFIHYEALESGQNEGRAEEDKSNIGDRCVRTSAFELHGSQSDTVLAPKPIYSEEDYEKMVKQGPHEDCAAPDTCSRHLLRATRRKTKMKEEYPRVGTARTSAINKPDKHVDGLKSRSAASVLTTFRSDNSSDFVSVCRDLDTDKESADSLAVKKRFERAIDVLERIHSGATPKANRFPKYTNKRLKQSSKGEATTPEEADAKDARSDRCYACKQFLGSSEHDEHNIPLEAMQAAIEKVLSQKGCSNNRCLLAFLDESYELNAKNAHYIYHGMLSPKCEPYIAKQLNLTESEVEIVENSGEEGGYLVRKQLNRPLSRGGGKIASCNSKSRPEKTKLFLSKQQSCNNKELLKPSRTSKDDAKMVSGDARIKTTPATQIHAKRFKEGGKRSGNASKINKMEASQIQKVQSEKVSFAKLKKSKNFSAADVQRLDGESEERPRLEACCGEKIAVVEKEKPPVFPDYLKPLTNFEEGHGRVRCYSTYWCFPEITDSSAGNNQQGESRDNETRSDSRVGRKQTPSPSVVNNANAIGCVRSEGALKRAPPGETSSGSTEFLGACAKETLFFNDRLTQESCCCLQISSELNLMKLPVDEDNEIEELERLRRLDERHVRDDEDGDESGTNGEERELCVLERRKGVTDIKTNSPKDVQDWCEDLQQFFTNSRRKQLMEEAERSMETGRIDLDDWKEFAAKDFEPTFKNKSAFEDGNENIAEKPIGDKCGTKSEKTLIDHQKLKMKMANVASAGYFSDFPVPNADEITDPPETVSLTNTVSSKGAKKKQSLIATIGEETPVETEETEDDTIIEVHYDNRISAVNSSEHCVEQISVCNAESVRSVSFERSESPKEVQRTALCNNNVESVKSESFGSSRKQCESVEEVSMFDDIPTADAEEHLVKNTILNEHSEAFLERVHNQRNYEPMSPSTSHGLTSFPPNRRIVIRKMDEAIDDEFIKKPVKPAETVTRKKDDKAINWKLYMAHRCLQLSDNMNVEDYMCGNRTKRRLENYQNTAKKRTTQHDQHQHRASPKCSQLKGDFRRKRISEANENLRDSFRYSGLRFEEYEGTVNIDEIMTQMNVNKQKKVLFSEKVRVLKDQATTYSLREENKKDEEDAETIPSDSAQNLEDWQAYIEEGNSDNNEGKEDDETNKREQVNSCQDGAAIEEVDPVETTYEDGEVLDDQETDRRIIDDDCVEMAKIEEVEGDDGKVEDDDEEVEGNDEGNRREIENSNGETLFEVDDAKIAISELNDDGIYTGIEEGGVKIEEIEEDDAKRGESEEGNECELVEPGVAAKITDFVDPPKKDAKSFLETIDIKDFVQIVTNDAKCENTGENEGEVKFEVTEESVKESGESTAYMETFVDIDYELDKLEEELNNENPIISDETAPILDFDVDDYDTREIYDFDYTLHDLGDTFETKIEDEGYVESTTFCDEGVNIERAQVEGERLANEEQDEIRVDANIVKELIENIVVDEDGGGGRGEKGDEKNESETLMDGKGATSEFPRTFLCLDRYSEETVLHDEANKEETGEIPAERDGSDHSSTMSEEDDLDMMDSGFSRVRFDDVSNVNGESGDNRLSVQDFDFESDHPDARFSTDSLEGEQQEIPIGGRRSSHGEGEGGISAVSDGKKGEEDEDELTNTSCDRSDEYHDANLLELEDEETNEGVFYDTESEDSLPSDQEVTSATPPEKPEKSDIALIEADINECLEKVFAEVPEATTTPSSALHGGGKRNVSQKSVHFKFNSEEAPCATVETKSLASLNTIYHVERENPQAAVFAESNSDMNCLHRGLLEKRLNEKVSLVEGVAASDSRIGEGGKRTEGESGNDFATAIIEEKLGGITRRTSSKRLRGEDAASDAYISSSYSRCNLEAESDVSEQKSASSASPLAGNVTIMQMQGIVAFPTNRRSDEHEIQKTETDAGSNAPPSTETGTKGIKIKIEKHNCGVKLTQRAMDGNEEDESDVVGDLLSENRNVGKTETNPLPSKSGSGELKKTVKISRNVRVDDSDEYMLLDERRSGELKKNKKSFPSVSKLGKKAKKDGNCKIS